MLPLVAVQATCMGELPVSRLFRPVITFLAEVNQSKARRSLDVFEGFGCGWSAHHATARPIVPFWVHKGQNIPNFLCSNSMHVAYGTPTELFFCGSILKRAFSDLKTAYFRFRWREEITRHTLASENVSATQRALSIRVAG